MKNVLPELSSLENRERVKLQKGDYIDLFYEAPELQQQYERSFMVDFTEYYHWGLLSKSNSVINSWDNLDYGGIIDSVLTLQPAAEEVVHSLEWLFELTEPHWGNQWSIRLKISM